MYAQMHRASTSFGIDNPDDFVFYATILVGGLFAAALLWYLLFRRR